MRILVVATEILLPDYHGGSTHIQELVRHLRKHGATMLLARRGSTGEGVTAVGRPFRRYPAAVRHIDAARSFPPALVAAKKFRPDVIYERGSSYGLGAMLSLGLGIPLVTNVLDERYSWLSLMRARRLTSTHLDIVPASVRAKTVKVSWGADPKLFDARLSKAEARARLGLDGAAVVVGYSGSFRPWHDMQCLSLAADRLRQRNIKYLIVGDGPLRVQIEQEIRRLGLADRFHFSGSVDYDKVPGLLAAADICVAPFDPGEHRPSRKHGFALDPLKLFEYLALGKATITIRAPNIEAMFGHGKHLLLVKPGSPWELAAAIARFADDPAFARATARAGRELVLQRHTWDIHASHLAAVFREIVAA